MAEDAVNTLSACEAAAAIRAGRLSAQALVEACLERIAAREPVVGAWSHLDADQALGAARAADAWQAAGRDMGPLHGVPVAVKDIIDTADMPTEYGFPAAFAGHRPSRDAACVDALRKSGAIVIGKTVTSPLAGPGAIKTRNPRDTARTPGTSSAGSAAAVADHMVPLGIGTQTAGSVIRPASFCGVVGLKPTFGYLSRRGALLQSHTLDTIGVLARNVVDAALLSDVLAAYDPHDPACHPGARSSLARAAAEELPGAPRFVFYPSPFWASAGAPTRDAFAGLIAALGASCATVDSAALDQALGDQQAVWAAEDAAHYGGLYDAHGADMSEILRDTIARGRAMGADVYIRALVRREAAYGELKRLLADGAILLTLASEGPAPLATAPFTPNVNGIWTFLGAPAVTLPLLDVDGLPVGVQLVAGRLADGRLLQVARWLEARFGKSA